VRTVCGMARRIQLVLGLGARRPAAVRPPAVRPAAVRRRPLLPGRLGEQRRGGVRLDQVDDTACGSAVLVALSAWADPAEVDRLDPGVGGAAGAGPDGVAAGFGDRYDARQRQVHAQTNRLWPRALGTTPWAMVRWLRRRAPAAGRYRVRLVDDLSPGDVAAALDVAGAALAAGRPVPLLVGSIVPRHYVMALAAQDGEWRVYEPSSGAVRALDLDLVRCRRLVPVLGFDRLHAVLLPA
jgi:hypothetical protein